MLSLFLLFFLYQDFFVFVILWYTVFANWYTTGGFCNHAAVQDTKYAVNFAACKASLWSCLSFSHSPSHSGGWFWFITLTVSYNSLVLQKIFQNIHNVSLSFWHMFTFTVFTSSLQIGVMFQTMFVYLSKFFYWSFCRFFFLVNYIAPMNSLSLFFSKSVFSSHFAIKDADPCPPIVNSRIRIQRDSNGSLIILILDGNSGIGAHVMSKFWYLICLRHLIISNQATNLF